MIREMGFRKADDFYIALGQSKISAKTVVNKVMQRLKAGEAVPATSRVAARRRRSRAATSASAAPRTPPTSGSR